MPLTAQLPVLFTYGRCSGGNRKSRYGHSSSSRNTTEQLYRVLDRVTIPVERYHPISEASRYPGKGRIYWCLVLAIVSGTVKAVAIEDVSRVTHCVQGLGMLWAGLIDFCGLQLYVANSHNPNAPITATEFLMLVEAHETAYLKKQAKRQAKGFKRNRKRLPACLFLFAGNTIIDPGSFNILLLPVFETARKVASRNPSLGRMKLYDEVARLLNRENRFTFNGKKWTGRNVRRVLNNSKYKSYFSTVCRAKELTWKNRQVSMMSINHLEKLVSNLHSLRKCFKLDRNLRLWSSRPP